MSNLNEFQQNFIKALSDIQEICVQQVALNQNDNQSLQDKYYDITSEIIIRIMELIDGYGNIGRLKVICEKSGFLATQTINFGHKHFLLGGGV